MAGDKGRRQTPPHTQQRAWGSKRMGWTVGDGPKVSVVLGGSVWDPDLNSGATS